jgi:hypothetical protein
MSNSKIIGEELIGTGKWLSLKNVLYQDEEGRERVS